MKAKMLKTIRPLSICCASLVILSILLLPSLALAELNTNSHWPVEITLRRRNSVYGTISGLNLSNGDCVGMFDADGNCHGAGRYRGNYYALTAFMREEADSENPGDETIEGFVEGEEVFFKVYQESTGKEYIVKHSSGNPYYFRYKGLTPLTKIDLLYEDEPADTPPPDTIPNPSSPPSSDALPADDGGGSSLTPMGAWALASEGESGPGSTSSGSEPSDRGGHNEGSGFQDTPSLDPVSSSSPRQASAGYGSSGGSLGGITKARPDTVVTHKTAQEDEPWKNALNNIDSIINRPLSGRRPSGEPAEPVPPVNNGMPLGTKLFLLFMTPGLAVVGIGIKLMS